MGIQEYLREPLGMTNSRIGYVYLVDENLKVRWAACADAKEEEEEALIRCAGVLLNRNKRPLTRSFINRQRRKEEE
jgi:mitochondrial ATPase complex subunit ATP10